MKNIIMKDRWRMIELQITNYETRNTKHETQNTVLFRNSLNGQKITKKKINQK